MAKILDMPKLSPTMTEGQLTVWHKKEGDPVAVDDLLAEVETDKATMEFRSFDKGTLLKQLVPAGTLVLLGQPVAILGAPGEDISSLITRASVPTAANAGQGAPATQAPSAPLSGDGAARGGAAAQEPHGPHGGRPQAAQTTTAQPSRAPLQPAAPQPERPRVEAPPPMAGTALADRRRVRASPYVRKLARERDLDLSLIAGTGPNGRIIARDVLDLPPQAIPSPGAGTAQPVEYAAMVSAAPTLAIRDDADVVRPLSMMRKAIARRLTESKQTIPHFYLTIDVDAGPLARLRDQINADLATAGHSGEPSAESSPVKVSFNDLLIKACALALVRVPDCNASFTPEAIVVHGRVDISVAVAVPDGLVTPVLRQADKKSITAIAREVRDLASRAKARKLRPEEMAGGTFSISNLGMFGIDSFSAVINPPEGAILAVGRVRDEAVVWEGAIVPGKRLAMTLSCDHRVVDGAVGARFLAELRTLVERPTQMLVF